MVALLKLFCLFFLYILLKHLNQFVQPLKSVRITGVLKASGVFLTVVWWMKSHCSIERFLSFSSLLFSSLLFSSLLFSSLLFSSLLFSSLLFSSLLFSSLLFSSLGVNSFSLSVLLLRHFPSFNEGEWNACDLFLFSRAEEVQQKTHSNRDRQTHTPNKLTASLLTQRRPGGAQSNIVWNEETQA